MFFSSETNDYIYHWEIPDQEKPQRWSRILEIGHLNVVEPSLLTITPQVDTSFLLLYVVQGQGIVTYRKRHFGLVPSDSILLRCEEGFSISNYDWEIKYIRFNIDHPGIDVDFPYHFDLSMKPQFERLYTRLDPRISKRRESRFTEDLDLLDWLSSAEESQVALTDSIDASIRSALIYIETNYHLPITVQEIATYCGYSPYYFCRRFRERMEIPIHRYLVVRRMRQAKFYLSSTSMKIEEIAVKCGYTNLSSFYVSFRKIEKRTPVEFRELSLKKARFHKI